MTALMIALVAAIIPTVAGGMLGYQIGAGMISTASAAEMESLRFLSPVRDWVLWAEITFATGTILGLWALVQGIVAVVRDRGRGAGIAAIVIAVLAALLFVIVSWISLFVGVASS